MLETVGTRQECDKNETRIIVSEHKKQKRENEEESRIIFVLQAIELMATFAVWRDVHERTKPVTLSIA